MKKNVEDSAINRYIRGRIKQARQEAKENQTKLAKAINISQVSMSDIERGRTAVNAALLVKIANHYKKSITYFYPDETVIQLQRIEEEMLDLFKKLPKSKQFETIDYIRKKIKE